jgi:type I restriction enzyme, S subunit
MKPGYKQTEVGVIPEEWEVAQVGETATKVGSGVTPTGGERVYKSEGRPFLRSQNVGWGVLLLDEVAFIDDAIHSTFADTEIKSGDVFLNITGASIGRSSVADSRVEGGNVNQHVCIIRADQERITPRFLNYLVLSTLGQRQIDCFQAGGNRQGLNFAQVRSIRLPLPPIPEQRAIATALSDVDALLAALDRLIAKQRDLKQAAMQQLLTGQTRLPGFEGEWETKRLGEIGAFFKGSGVKKDESQSGPLPCIRYGEIYTRHNDYIKEFHSFISTQVAATACPLKKGDLLFAGSGETKEEIGKCVAFVDDFEAYAGGDIVILRPQGIDSLFLGYSLNTPLISRQKASRGQGDAVVHIGSSALAGITLNIPPLPEQTAIATVLSDMDAELTALEQRRDKTRALKQGMMQELLTGRTRLM